MNKSRFTINNTAAGIVVMLLLIGGIGATSILFSTAHAQTPTLGKPIFVEKGADTIKRQIGPNITQYTFTSNGTMNGNIEYHKKGSMSASPKVTTRHLIKGTQ